MRDDIVMGPASIAPSVPVPNPTDSAGDTHIAFLSGNPIRTNGKLLTIWQGDCSEPGQ